DVRSAALGIAFLALSRSFVDYSTSGLENPLTHLLLAVFLALYVRGDESPRAMRWMAAIAALALMTRPDTLLLVAPPLAAALWRHRDARSLFSVGQGLIPLLLWSAFALLYFGSPIPNTAISKLDADVPGLWMQGLRYLQISAEADPLLPLGLVAGPALALVLRVPRSGAVAAGIALDLLYTVSIGGDFMAGRFLTDSLFCGVALLTCLPPWAPHRIATAAAAIPLLAAIPVLRSHFGDGGPWHAFQEQPHRPLPRYGISDERRWYRHQLGLIAHWRSGRPAPAPAASETTDTTEDAATERTVAVEGTAGVQAYKWGPAVHVVDLHALTDPLLARLPAMSVDWRPGHARRVVPPGYIETLRTGEMHLEDERLARLYETLDSVHRGALFDPARLRAIAELLLFGSGDFVDADYYRKPPRLSFKASELRDAAPRSFLMPGVVVRWDRPGHPRNLRASLSEQHDFMVTFVLARQPLATIPAKATGPGGRGLAEREIEVPDVVRRRGFDAVVIASDTWYSDQQFRIGGVSRSNTR
ncbi:MAG: hypothetical protein ACE5FL_14015, partial [Myxococcota bacterium]